MFLSEYVGNEKEKKLRDRIDDGPDCYERILKAESHKGYEDMVDFIATVEEQHLSKLLELAISGKGAFR